MTFINPLPGGERLRLRAQLLRRSRSTVHARCDIETADGSIACSVVGIFGVARASQFVREMPAPQPRVAFPMPVGTMKNLELADLQAIWLAAMGRDFQEVLARLDELPFKVYEMQDFEPPSSETLARLRAIIDEAFGRSGNRTQV